ncbi:MAG: TIM barrel protein [candidate division KSB1 bacterium]
MLSRRNFLKTSAGVLAGMYAFEAKSLFAKEKSLERIGVQLYSVRSLMEKDFEGTLKKVAALGYKEFEFAGYYERKPKDLKKFLDDLGVKAPSTHQGLAVFEQKLDWLLETAAILGHKYVVCPWLSPEMRTSIDTYKKLAASFNKFGEACQKAGMHFAYHNHDFEFETIDGQIPYDVLLVETDPKFVQMEIDLYWIAKAGKDVFAYFDKAPGRYALCHVKDMDENGAMMSVGTGKIDFGKIFAHAKHAGLKHFFVEHDNPPDPLQSITASVHHLKALKF